VGRSVSLGTPWPCRFVPLQGMGRGTEGSWRWELKEARGWQEVRGPCKMLAVWGSGWVWSLRRAPTDAFRDLNGIVVERAI
jgi:hypothetical protein